MRPDDPGAQPAQLNLVPRRRPRSRQPGRPRVLPRFVTGPLLHVVSFDLLRKAPAPEIWRMAAHEHGVTEVWLVDDWQLTSSYHHPAEHTIYVNTRGSEWYTTALEFQVERYTEAVTLWFLHELGHAAHAHTGVSSRALRFGTDDPREVQAWHFALAFRQAQPERWQQLEQAYRAWYSGYRHRHKDWPDDLDEARNAGWPARAYRGWPAIPWAVDRLG